jgi:hypothetical protein
LATSRTGAGSSACIQPASGGQRRQHQADARQPVQQVAERQAHPRPVGPAQHGDQRVERAAEIGAEHHGDRGLRPDAAAAGQRRHEEHAGHRGMRRPGDQRRQQQVRQRLVSHHREQGAERGRGLHRRERLHQHVQRQQHEAEADRDAAEVARAGARGVAEGGHAGQHQHRRQPAEVEGQDLHDQRRAHIRAQHRGQRMGQPDRACRREARHHQRGRRAALQRRGHAEPGEGGAPGRAERGAEPCLQPPAEGTLHAALHHVQAPEQQRSLPGDLQEKSEIAQDRPASSILAPQGDRMGEACAARGSARGYVAIL